MGCVIPSHGFKGMLLVLLRESDNSKGLLVILRIGGALVVIGAVGTPIHLIQISHSLYNYFICLNVSLPDAEKVKGACPHGRVLVCTDRGRAHESLALMGRSALGPVEQALFQQHIDVNETTPNPIFLYESLQLNHLESDAPDNKADGLPLFWLDLSQYLELDEPLKPGKLNGENHSTPDALNICEDRYGELRVTLTDIGRASAQWIRQYFLDADNVFVSDRSYFESLLDNWSTDPCLGRRRLDSVWLDNY